MRYKAAETSFQESSVLLHGLLVYKTVNRKPTFTNRKPSPAFSLKTEPNRTETEI